MLEPKYPSEKYVLSRIGFHASGAIWYREHGQLVMADWSEAEAAKWREKLADQFELAAERPANSKVIPFPQGVNS